MAKKKQIRDGQDGALTRRENQVMDIVYAGRAASERDIHEKLADPPTYSTVRTPKKPSSHILSFILVVLRSESQISKELVLRLTHTVFEAISPI